MNITMMPTLNAPVVYYRMENFVKQFRKMGHTVGFSYWGPGYTNTCNWEHDLKPGEVNTFLEDLYDSVSHSDIVVFQSVHTKIGISVIMALQEQFRKVPILSEYDDSIYSVNSSSPSFKWTGPGGDVEWVGDKQLEASDGLIVSTDYLKKIYSKKNCNIAVVPNAIDFEVWSNLKEKKKGKKIKIGWEGGANHETNLRLIKNVVPTILAKYKNVEFHFKYGGHPIDYLKGKRIKFDDYHKWTSVDKHPQSMKNANFDIGIAPLRDLDFNRSKSNLRFLEYSALGIPTVASPVEPYLCIEHGKTGYLASNDNEWVECLSKLIENEELRRYVGKTAYLYVRDNHSVEVVAKDYIKKLEGYIGDNNESNNGICTEVSR